METNSVKNRLSRYVHGGQTEASSWALEWWERNSFQAAADDTQYVVEKAFEGRLDQIAAIQLGEPRYWWFIAMLNNILDPYNEIREGVILRIPTLERVRSSMTGALGGFPSQREVSTTVLPIV